MDMLSKNSISRGLATFLLVTITGGLVTALIHLTLGVSTTRTQTPQSYSAATGVTAFVYAFPEGIDIGPVFGDQHLQWNENTIRVQEKLQLPFTDSQVQNGIKRTFWSYLTSQENCLSPLGFSAAFFNKFDIFVNLCGQAVRYKVNERGLQSLNGVGSMRLVRANKTRSTLIYTMRTNAQYMLVQKPMDAADDANMKITILPSHNDSERSVGSLELPSQNILRLSPVDGYAAILDHSHSGKIQLANLATADATELQVPRLSRSQIHFNPVFVTEGMLAFSVFDKNGWQTVSYDINARRYDVVSEKFSDQIYPTGDGGLLLLQTSVELIGNIPFAAKSIQREKRETALPGATLTFVRWKNGESENVQSIPVSMSVDERYFLYTRNTIALLGLLGAPKAVQTEYLSRSRFREKDNIPYEMIDWL